MMFFSPCANSLFIKEQMPGIETIMLFVAAENEHSLGEVYSFFLFFFYLFIYF